MLIAPPVPLLTIDHVAERLGVDRDAVSAFIRNGELIAVNVNRSRTAKRPTWRIRPEDLETFEKSRSTSKPVVASRPRRPKSTARKWF